jgi:hypothetical protein
MDRAFEVTTIRGRKVVGGVSEADALVTRERISGWGGVDPRRGTVVETQHELRGRSFAGKMLVFPGAKGSSGDRVRDDADAGVVTILRRS